MRRALAPLAGFVLLLCLALVAVAAAAPSVTEYPLTTHDLGPTGIALGPDGNVWFTEASGAGGIGKIATGGAITEYTTGLTAKSQPTGIAVGPDGNLWFTELANPGRIGSITPEGVIAEFTTGLSTNSQPTGIAAGSDGNLWFTEAANPGRIGRITPAGAISEFSTSLTPNRQPSGIAAGPDGNLWFTETGGTGAIGRITPSGTITEFTTGLTSNSRPTGIAAGPDGNMWFTEAGPTARIGRITLGGTITEFATGLTANSHPEAIAAGNDGAMYFTEPANPGRIGRITTAGTITETATTTSGSDPQQIVTGADGNMWFTEFGQHGLIGTIAVAPGVAPGSPASTEKTAVLKALVNPDSQATNYHFEYGTSSAYGSSTATASAGNGASLTSVSKSVSGLEPGTLYHYRALATNATGTTAGPDQTVTTGIAPTATTHAASAVSLTSAVLNANVNPHGVATSYVFEWGTSTAYGNETTLAEAGSESALTHVAQTIEGLAPDTRYYFRVRATNCGGCEEGSTIGADETFTTAAVPISITEAASAVTQTGATLNGSLDPRGAETSYRFDWGETEAYGRQTSVVPVAGSSGAQSVSATLSALQPGHVYHYRLVATNCEGCEAGTHYGADMVLVTEALAVVPATPLGPAAALPSLPAAPVSPPALGHTALVKVLAGTVSVKGPGGAPIALGGPADIPVGATVDTRHGKLELTTALEARGSTQTATVWNGVFTVGQSVSAGGMTTMTVPAAAGCRRPRAKASALIARAKKPETLWARDNHGRYSTRGHNSVATVRGTWWATSDRCGGTLTTVRQGLISVRPRHGRAVLVHAGHSYLARR